MDKVMSRDTIYVAFPSGNVGYIIGFDINEVNFGTSNGYPVIEIDNELFVLDPLMVMVTGVPSKSDPEGRFVCYNPRTQDSLPAYEKQWIEDHPGWTIESGLKQIMDVIYSERPERDRIIDLRRSVFNATDSCRIVQEEESDSVKETIH